MMDIHVGPLALVTIQKMAVEHPAEINTLFVNIGYCIDHIKQSNGPRSYSYTSQNGNSVTMDVCFLDGELVIFARIQDKDCNFAIGDDMAWMKNLPSSAVMSYEKRSRSGTLRVKDVVAMLPDDDRLVRQTTYLSETEKLWFQYDYNNAAVIKTWPTWDDLQEGRI